MSTTFSVDCEACGAAADFEHLGCRTCGGQLRIHRTTTALPEPDQNRTGMWRYWRRLPVRDPASIVSLGEGGTPLLPSRRLDRQVWFKNETLNPTGSHKDRALSVALTHAVEVGATESVVVSSGSTGLANAAYAARAGLSGYVVVSDSTPWRRTVGCEVLGATVVRVHAQVDSLVDRVAQLGRDGVLYASSTGRATNPYQAEASTTISFEIHEQLGGFPDWVVLPAGGGGTLSALWQGFSALSGSGLPGQPPRLLAAVSDRYDAIAVALEQGLGDPGEVYEEDFYPGPTILSKIAHTHPPDGLEALEAIRASRGTTIRVTDAEAAAAQMTLGAEEGYFVEPSSAAAMVALDVAIRQGMIAPTDCVVVLLTGSGHREVDHLTGPLRPQSTISLDQLKSRVGRSSHVGRRA